MDNEILVEVGTVAKTLSLSLVIGVITASFAVVLSYYCFFHREIIRERKEKRKVKTGLKGLTRSPSMDNLGLNILFEDLQNKLGPEGLEESMIEEDDLEATGMEQFEETPAGIAGSLDSVLKQSDSGLTGEEQPAEGPSLPLDMLAFLKSIKVFGYFEEPVFLSLYKHSETMQVSQGDYLFKRGDRDFSLYVVVKGSVSILVSPGTSMGSAAHQHHLHRSRLRRQGSGAASSSAPQTQHSSHRGRQAASPRLAASTGSTPGFPEEDEDGLIIAEMHGGESVTSLINAVSVMLYGDRYKEMTPSKGSEVTARASSDATLVRIPASAFLLLGEQFPKVCLHMIQVIVTRFHRVTFLTLNRVLGLTDEFLQVEALTPPTMSPDNVEDDGASQSSSEKVAIGPIELELLCAFTRLPEADVQSLFSDPRLSYAGDSDSEGGADAASGSGPASSSSAHLALVGEMEIAYVEAGERLIQEGEKEAGMFFVLKGELSVTMRSVDSTKQKLEQARGQQRGSSAASRSTSVPVAAHDDDHFMFPCKPGSMTGYLSLLTHYPSIVDVHAATDATVGYISQETFDRRVQEEDGLSIVKLIARHLVESMSPLARIIDFALDWVHINAGHVLFREGDESDSLFIVLSGRLRSAVTRGKGKVENAGEFGQGDSLGEFDVFTEMPRASSVYAIRDSELIRMPKALMKVLAVKIPSVAVQISRLTAQQSIQQLYQLRHPEAPVLDVRTVALLPVTPDVPLGEFAERLTNALSVIGPTLCLTRAHAADALGKNMFTKMGSLRIASWLEAQEENHRTVVYTADPTPSVWTQRCIRQADLILLVGLAEHPSAMPSLMERALQRMKTAARKELVLVYGVTGSGRAGPTARIPVPKGTATWLQERPWITATHHIRLRQEDSVADGTAAAAAAVATAASMKTSPSADSLKKLLAQSMNRAASDGTGTKGRSIEMKSRGWMRARTHSLTSPSRRPSVMGTGLSELASVSSAYSRQPAGNAAAVYRRSDFGRLARRLTGKSIGLVLGGGGARGLAHLGVIRALEDAGIPIDVIGGTSMGAMVGGLYARDTDSLAVTSFLRRFATMMSGRLTLLMDLTYPITSIFTGRAFNRIIRKTVGPDVQIEDLWIPYVCVTTNLTHSRMETHRYGSAWRYIRASMTLTGYLPPLSDKGMLLVDGGYTNNLPADVVRTLGADHIIAVDVSSEDDTSPVQYDDAVSGWWLLLSRLNPFGSPHRIPTMNDIQERLAYVSSVRTLEEVKNMDHVLYLRPPVSGYKTLEWSALPDLVDIGYRYAEQKAKDYMKNVLLNED